MEWQEKNGILIRRQTLQPIEIFVDETFFHDRSGFLQAAFAAPKDIYDQVIVPRSRELLKQLGPQAKEFKGSAIKRGNVRPYREFLYLFIDISARIADQAPLYAVVSLDATTAYAGQQFDCVRFNVVGALNNMHVTDADFLAEEFSRQMLWLHRHFPLIAPRGFRNDVVLTFDAKYLHAEESRAARFFSGDKLIVATTSTLESVFSSCARTLFSDHRSDIRLPNIGRVDRFRFVRSPDEFGLQAADVLSHLLYSAIRKSMGINDPGVDFKVQVLNEVMPDFEIDDALRASLTVVTGPDGRQDLRLTNPQFRSRFQLTAAPLDDTPGELV